MIGLGVDIPPSHRRTMRRGSGQLVDIEPSYSVLPSPEPFYRTRT